MRRLSSWGVPNREDAAKKLEISEKRILIEEIETLLKNSISLEINSLYKKIDLENRFLSFLIELRRSNLQDIQKEILIKEIEHQIEQELQGIIQNYPPFCFYDLIGDLIGLTNESKKEIVSHQWRTAGFQRNCTHPQAISG